ncbi:MAG: hypothetical protein ACFE8G_11390 [Candidatus Hermodarchaeota archaeon]
MISKVIEKKSQSLEENIIDEDSINFSDFIIPFSKFFHRIELLDIYSGEEIITFEERDSEFKKILKTEFL